MNSVVVVLISGIMGVSVLHKTGNYVAAATMSIMAGIALAYAGV